MKKIFTIFTVLLVAFSLMACDKKQEPKQETAELKLQGQKVTIWHTYTKAQQEAIDASVKRFNETNPYGITVVVEQQDRKDFASKVLQSTINKVGPDIIIDYPTTAADYAKDGLVVNFENFINHPEYGIENFKSTVLEGTLKEATGFADGGMYVFPLIQSGPIFLYNKTIYDELGLKVPTTWEELTVNSAKIKEKYPEKYGFAFESLADGAQTLIAQANGGIILDAADKKTNFNNENVYKQFEWFKENVSNGNFMLTPTGQYFSEDFNSELLASYVGSVAGVPYIKLENFGVAPIPQGAGDTKWAPAWNRSAIVFTSNPSQEMAAYLFVKHFASPEENAKFTIACNYASPLLTTHENAEYKAYVEKDNALKQLSVEIAGAYPPLAGTMTLRNGLEGAMKAVATGEKDVKTAIEDVVKETDESIAEAYAN